MHNTLHILLILAHIIFSISLLTGQHNFLPLSQSLLGVLLFLITIEQIRKKDSGTRFICIVAGAFI
ncbi:hypothetical protein DT250_22235 [Bacillus sp. AR2-1]|uniref:DUF3953 domain-containing protein n=1 Tax=Bacillus sp. AR2-1 TaxID=2217816 RepID=UPI0011EFA23A|nr:DUF3953 domain-containing protein [Bacillus sp. AR2-1]KAA0763376.1 hypothetical protein DT250_22235 [Bacillus sp. AR2-1]